MGTKQQKEEVKKRKRQPAYKPGPPINTQVGSAVSDGFSQLQELGEEMREGYDNMESNNLGQTDKCQRYGEAADALESLNEPDVPEAVAELDATYREWVPTRKGRGTSRERRRDNATASLQAAKEVAEAWLEDEENKEHDDRDEVEQFVTELEGAVDEAESVEFPGMFG